MAGLLRLIPKVGLVASALWGSSSDNFQAAIELTSGDLLIIGSSRSSNGDLNSNAGQTDAWVLRLNGANGQLIGSNEFGGSGYDVFYRAIEKSDGSIVLIGSSSSSNGDVVGWHSGTINGQILAMHGLLV